MIKNFSIEYLQGTNETVKYSFIKQLDLKCKECGYMILFDELLNHIICNAPCDLLIFKSRMIKYSFHYNQDLKYICREFKEIS